MRVDEGLAELGVVTSTTAPAPTTRTCVTFSRRRSTAQKKKRGLGANPTKEGSIEFALKRGHLYSWLGSLKSGGLCGRPKSRRYSLRAENAWRMVRFDLSKPCKAAHTVLTALTRVRDASAVRHDAAHSVSDSQSEGAQDYTCRACDPRRPTREDIVDHAFLGPQSWWPQDSSQPVSRSPPPYTTTASLGLGINRGFSKLAY